MIIDARIPINGKLPITWNVYHAEAMQMLRNVLWLNDETAQYSLLFVDLEAQELNEQIMQAKKITLFMDKELAIINPIEFFDDPV